jgi:hypothetical protein
MPVRISKLPHAPSRTQMENEISTKESKMKGNQNIMTSGQGCGDKGKCAHEFDRSDLTGRSVCPRLGIWGQEGLMGMAPGAEESTASTFFPIWW